MKSLVHECSRFRSTPPLKIHKHVALVLLLLFSFYAKAQIGLYAEFSGAKLNVPNTNWIYGPTFGAYFDKGHLLFLSAGLDARGAFLGSGSTVLNSGLVGPRVAFRPHVIPIQPYVEALIGVGHAEYGQGVVQTTATKFEYQFYRRSGLDGFASHRLAGRRI
jgi:hypothetical protein